MAGGGGSTLDTGAAGQRYSSVAIALHWIIALALAFQLALGFAMPSGPEGFALFQLHKSVGITILLLSFARLAWRLTHRPPAALEDGFQGFLARAVHASLYVFMIGAPLTGWALVSTSSIVVPTVLWGLIPWPHLPLPNGLSDLAEQAHELLAWLGIALIVLHVAGALRHQWLVKDNLMRRIAPGGRATGAFALLALVMAVYFGTGMFVASRYLVPAQERQAAEQVAAAAVPTTSDQQGAQPASEDVLALDDDEQAEEEAEEAEQAAEDPVADAAPPVWSIQPGGRLGFSLDGGAGSIRGSFSDWNGEIRMDPDRPETADLRITVRLASATLGDATMDSTVQGADFFGTSANPVATWRSTSVRRTGPNRYTAQGTLSLKGASRPQAITFTLSGQGLRRQVEGSATIDRTAFGVGTGDTAAGLSSAVSVEFTFEAQGRAP